MFAWECGLLLVWRVELLSGQANLPSIQRLTFCLFPPEIVGWQSIGRKFDLSSLHRDAVHIFPGSAKMYCELLATGDSVKRRHVPLCPGYRQPLDFLSKKLFANNLNKTRNCAAFGHAIPNAHQAKMCYINKDSQKQPLRCYIERPKHSVNEIDLEMVQMVW